jgi:membrane protease YdiL (CAAX protease family)
LRIVTSKIPGPAILGTAVAIILSSAMFAAGHAYQGALGLVQTFAAGAAFAVLTTWRKSIWPSIIAHISIDTFALVAAHFLEPALKNLAK